MFYVFKFRLVLSSLMKKKLRFQLLCKAHLMHKTIRQNMNRDFKAKLSALSMLWVCLQSWDKGWVKSASLSNPIWSFPTRLAHAFPAKLKAAIQSWSSGECTKQFQRNNLSKLEFYGMDPTSIYNLQVSLSFHLSLLIPYFSLIFSNSCLFFSLSSFWKALSANKQVFC